MLLSCPKCGKEIDSANINIAKDIAFCASCGEVYNISKLSVESAPQEQSKETAAAPVKQSTTPPNVEVAEEKTYFNVILKAYDEDKKISVIKEVKEIADLNLKEGKNLVEGVPKLLKKGVSKEEAAQIRYRINAAGGIVEIQSTEAAVPQAKTRVCVKCGAQLKEGLKFCTKCGTPVGATADATKQMGSSGMADGVIYLDFADGVKKVMNNVKLYVKLLTKFKNDTKLDKLEVALESSDFETAQEEVRTIKGIANNLSLTELFKQSLELETQIKGKSVSPVQVKTVKSVLALTVQEVDMVITENENYYIAPAANAQQTNTQTNYVPPAQPNYTSSTNYSGNTSQNKTSSWGWLILVGAIIFAISYFSGKNKGVTAKTQAPIQNYQNNVAPSPSTPAPSSGGIASAPTLSAPAQSPAPAQTNKWEYLWETDDTRDAKSKVYTLCNRFKYYVAYPHGKTSFVQEYGKSWEFIYDIDSTYIEAYETNTEVYVFVFDKSSAWELVFTNSQSKKNTAIYFYDTRDKTGINMIIYDFFDW
jgi:large subunit ribosomal protein L7/L12